MEDESVGYETTAVQTEPEPEPEEQVRGSSVLSWPSSYRSSRMVTPDTQRLLDSQLGDAVTTPTSKRQTIKLPQIYNDVIIEEEKTVTSLSQKGDLNSARTGSGETDGSKESAQLPPLKCSLYTHIGNPSLDKRRSKKPPPVVLWPTENKKKQTGLSQKWKRGNNALDNNTIYSTKQQKYYDKVASKHPPLLPPIEVSQRSESQNKADAGTAKEKEIVMRNFFLTGKMKRFEENKAVLPTVYKNVLDDSAKKRTYVNTLYNHQLARRSREPSTVDCTKRRQMPEQQCEFCDVMGNKYCSYCIEFKNRHFALGYEKNFMLPQLPALKTRRTRAGSHLAGILINANDGLRHANPRGHRR